MFGLTPWLAFLRRALVFFLLRFFDGIRASMLAAVTGVDGRALPVTNRRPSLMAMARHELAQYDSFAQLLGGIAGVWEGTYTHLTPAGGLIERYGSRQETRLRGTDWFERIIYTREGQEREVLDFKARITGDTVTFDDPDFHGISYLVEGRLTVFPYHWKSNPSREIVEIITLATDIYRTRLWQTFDDGALTRLTVIEESRRRDQTPDEWA